MVKMLTVVSVIYEYLSFKKTTCKAQSEKLDVTHHMFECTAALKMLQPITKCCIESHQKEVNPINAFPVSNVLPQ